jgi:hypothetical protein
VRFWGGGGGCTLHERGRAGPCRSSVIVARESQYKRASPSATSFYNRGHNSQPELAGRARAAAGWGRSRGATRPSCRCHESAFAATCVHVSTAVGSSGALRAASSMVVMAKANPRIRAAPPRVVSSASMSVAARVQVREYLVAPRRSRQENVKQSSRETVRVRERRVQVGGPQRCARAPHHSPGTTGRRGDARGAARRAEHNICLAAHSPDLRVSINPNSNPKGKLIQRTHPIREAVFCPFQKLFIYLSIPKKEIFTLGN